VPSNRLNSKWGKVLPTSIPIAGRSTIVGNLEAAVGVYAGPDVGSGSAPEMGVAVESGTDDLSGAAVGSGAAVNAGTVTRPGVGVNTATGARLDAVSIVDAGDEAGRASVGLVTQAKTPSMIAVMGKASSCDIPDYTQASEWTTRFLRVIWYPT